MIVKKYYNLCNRVFAGLFQFEHTHAGIAALPQPVTMLIQRTNMLSLPVPVIDDTSATSISTSTSTATYINMYPSTTASFVGNPLQNKKGRTSQLYNGQASSSISANTLLGVFPPPTSPPLHSRPCTPSFLYLVPMCTWACDWIPMCTCTCDCLASYCVSTYLFVALSRLFVLFSMYFSARVWRLHIRASRNLELLCQAIAHSTTLQGKHVCI